MKPGQKGRDALIKIMDFIEANLTEDLPDADRYAVLASLAWWTQKTVDEMDGFSEAPKPTTMH